MLRLRLLLTRSSILFSRSDLGSVSRWSGEGRGGGLKGNSSVKDGSLGKKF